MPTDLQLIDGFENLRAAFQRANPDFVLDSPPLSEIAESPRQQVAVAWVQAIMGQAQTAEALRRRRALVRAALAGEAVADPAPPLRPAWLGEFPAALRRAAEARLWPLASSRDARSLAEQAAAWQGILPGLSALRAWRLLALLGLPAIPPEAAIRRLLWRLGIAERAVRGDEDLVRTHSELERILRLSGLPAGVLATLLTWLTGRVSGFKSGAWCGVKPRCGACPLRGCCAWGRFHPAESGDSTQPAGESRPRLDPIRNQIVAGRQSELAEIELLALVLQGGGAGLDGFAVAEGLLRRYGSLGGIERASVAELAKTRGISTARAAQLKAALELGRRFGAESMRQGDPIRSSEDVFRAFRHRFRNLPQEHFVIVLLDAKNRVLHDHIVSKGSLTGSLAHPREVFQQAIRHSAAGIILLHNHPSGDPTPSPEDRGVTRRLQDAGEILGIKVLDHIILGADEYYSFRDEA